MATPSMEYLSDAVKGKIYQLVANDDLELVAVPPECLCNHCRMVVIFNRSFPCGHAYCRSCYDNLLTQQRTCWRCSSKAGFIVVQNMELEKRICEMQTFCCNRKYGCSQIVSLGGLLKHLEECIFSNSKFLSSLEAVDKNVEINLNEVSTGLQDDVTNKLKSVSVSLEHLKQLLETKICFVEMERPEFRQAIKRKMIDENTWVSKKLRVSKKKKQIEDYDGTKTIASSGKKDFLELSGDDFYSSECGYKMRMVVRFGRDHLDVLLQFLPGDHHSGLAAVYRHRRTFFILDRSGREDKRDVVRVEEPRFRDGVSEKWMREKMGISSICTYDFLEKQFKDVYLKENSIILKVVVEPIFPLHMTPTSTDGTLNWKVENYWRTKQECQDGILDAVYSESFYGDQRGHRIQCRLTFDSTSVYVRLFFLESEHDDDIGDVFRHEANFAVQSHDGWSSLVAIRKFDSSFMGHDEAQNRMRALDCHVVFFRYQDYENFHFLTGDSISIKVLVRPISKIC